MWGYIHSEPVPFREGNFEKMSSDTFNSYPSLSTVTHAEWRMTGAWQCNRTDRFPSFPVSQQYLSKSEPGHPGQTIIEKSTLLPMCLCLCPQTDSSENSRSVGLVLKSQKEKAARATVLHFFFLPNLYGVQWLWDFKCWRGLLWVIISHIS